MHGNGADGFWDGRKKFSIVLYAINAAITKATIKITV